MRFAIAATVFLLASAGLAGAQEGAEEPSARPGAEAAAETAGAPSAPEAASSRPARASAPAALPRIDLDVFVSGKSLARFEAAARRMPGAFPFRSLDRSGILRSLARGAAIGLRLEF